MVEWGDGGQDDGWWMDLGQQWWLEETADHQERKKSKTKGQKWEWKVIYWANQNNEWGQKKEENRGSQMNQQSGELVKEWVRYEGNKKMRTSKIDEVIGGHPGHQSGSLGAQKERILTLLSAPKRAPRSDQNWWRKTRKTPKILEEVFLGW